MSNESHEWKLVPTDWFKSLPEEKQRQITEQDEERTKDQVMEAISAFPSRSFEDGLGRINEYQSYFPGANKLPEDGCWVLVKESPPTEYTVPPLSVWYAVPWPMDGYPVREELRVSGRRRKKRGSQDRHTIHRVKLRTLRGDLGLFPHEYSRIDDVGKYLEFIGDGMEIKFFGGVEGVPPDQLFYLRSRGISKQEAIKLLLGNIRSPEVCWIESSREVAETFGMNWPDQNRLVTVAGLESEKSEKTLQD